MKRFKVEFQVASPVILQGRLYLDAVLLSLGVQAGIPYEVVASELPITQWDGIYRCSQLLWDGLPDTIIAKKQMNIWTPRELDDHAKTTQKGFTKSDRKKNYKPLMDEYPAMDIPQVFFIVETDNPECLLAAVQNIPALGKWSRKGYGNIAGVAMTSTGDDPWVMADGCPARALPVDLWERMYGGPHALAMENIHPPYWATNQAQLCAVEKIV